MADPRGEAYAGLWDRIVRSTALTDEPTMSTPCWTWFGKSTKNYPSINVRCDGKHRTLKVHRAMLVLKDCGAEVNLFWALYHLASVMKLEADHLCFNNPLCANPDHLQWLTREEHEAKGRAFKLESKRWE